MVAQSNSTTDVATRRLDHTTPLAAGHQADTAPGQQLGTSATVAQDTSTSGNLPLRGQDCSTSSTEVPGSLATSGKAPHPTVGTASTSGNQLNNPAVDGHQQSAVPPSGGERGPQSRPTLDQQRSATGMLNRSTGPEARSADVQPRQERQASHSNTCDESPDDRNSYTSDSPEPSSRPSSVQQGLSPEEEHYQRVCNSIGIDPSVAPYVNPNSKARVEDHRSDASFNPSSQRAQASSKSSSDKGRKSDDSHSQPRSSARSLEFEPQNQQPRQRSPPRSRDQESNHPQSTLQQRGIQPHNQGPLAASSPLGAPPPRPVVTKYLVPMPWVDLRSDPRALSKEGITWLDLLEAGKRHYFQRAASECYVRTGILPSFRIKEQATADNPWSTDDFDSILWEQHKKITIPWVMIEPVLDLSEDDMDTAQGGAPTKRRAQSPVPDVDGTSGPDRNKRRQDTPEPVPTPSCQPRSAEYIQQKIDEYHNSPAEIILRKKIAILHQRHQDSLKLSEQLINDQTTPIEQLQSRLSIMSTAEKTTAPTIEQLQLQLASMMAAAKPTAPALNESWPPSASSIIQLEQTLAANKSSAAESFTLDQSASVASSARISDRLLSGNITNLGIEVFAGFTCANTVNWIRRFEIKCKSALASELRAFPSYCDDNTYQFLQGMQGLPTLDMVSSTVSAHDLWEQLKVVLLRTFAVESDQQALTEELYRRKQLGGETVGAFATQLTSLGSRLSPPWTAAMLKPVLIKGLNPAIFEKFPRLSGEETFSWIIEQARYWEARLTAHGDRIIKREAMGSLHVMNPVREQESDEEPNESQPHLAAFNKRPDHKFKPRFNSKGLGPASTQPKLPPLPNELPYSDRFPCSHCGRIGHSSAHCRGKAAGRPPWPGIKHKAGVKLCSFNKQHSAAVSGFARDLDRNWVHVAMLADSGADENFVTSSFIKRLRLKPVSLKPMEYRDGSDKVCHTAGSVELKIRLHQNVFFYATFHIIETCPYEVILGPALAIRNGSFDFRSRSLRFPGGIVIPSAAALPAELDGLPIDHPAMATFFAGKHTNGAEDDFLDDNNNITTVLNVPSTAETEALYSPGGNKYKCRPKRNPDLAPTYGEILDELIEEYLAKGLWDQPCNKDREDRQLDYMRIQLKPGTTPVWMSAARPNIHQTKIIEETVALYLKLGIIVRSNSPWSCRAFLTEKLRTVLDFRLLNEATIAEKFDTLIVQDILDQLGNSVWLSQGDLCKAYHQFLIHPDDQHLTGFSVPSGHYHFRVVPFGLAGAPAFFNKQMKIALAGVEFSWSFFDDISTGTKTVDGEPSEITHIKALRAQFEALDKYGLKLEPSKCFYAFKSIKVLGFEVIAGKGVTYQEKLVEPITRTPPPSDKKALRSFLGAVQVYAWTIPMLAEHTQPLNQLLKGTMNGPLPEWLDVHQKEFQWIKDRLASFPVMRSPDPAKRFVLCTDASTSAVGGVLQQADSEGNLNPIMYTSKQLTSSQKNYTTQELEGLSLIRCLTVFSHYILGTEFDVITDHQALLNIKTSQSPSLRVQRWSMLMQQFNFIIHHKAGHLHKVADWLSRPDQTLPPTRFVSLIALSTKPEGDIADRSTWLRNQARDDFCLIVIRSIQDGSSSDKQFQIDSDSLLYHHEFHTDALQLVVPFLMQHQILEMCHSLPTAAHAGVKRMSDRVSRSFFWPDWKRAVAHFVEACEPCQQLKLPRQRTDFVMATPRPVVAQRFNQLVSIDVQGPFVPTTLGNTYVLNISDIFSHFSVSLAISNTTTLTVATTLMNSWFQFFGVPQNILSDNGTNFTAEMFTEMMTLFSTKGVLTTPYHPQANPVERFGRTLNTAIAKHVSECQNDWDQFLGLVNYAYNTSMHSVTGVSPAAVVFKVAPTTLMEFIHMLPINLELRTVWARRGRAIMDSALEQCRDATLTRVKKASATINPIRGAEEPFGVGDIVWLTDRHGPRDGRKAKHTLRHTGPYQVTQCNGHFSYWVQHVTTGVKYRAHYLHMTLAPESTQAKYRGGSSQKEEGRSESPMLIPPLRSDLKQQPTGVPTPTVGPSLTPRDTPTSHQPTSVLHIEADTQSSQLQDNLEIINPYGPNFKDTLHHSSVSTSGDSANKLTQHLTTQTTRSGRAVVVPTRYLNMFLTFQTPGHLQVVTPQPSVEERECGRM